MATFDASDGFALHVTDDGPKDAPAVVLMHGLGSDGRTDQPLVHAIGDRLRVLRLDLRGHGGSAPLREVDRFGWFDRAARDVVELLDHFEVEQAGVHGGSLGAAVATAAGLQVPQRVRTLGIGYPAIGPGEDFSNPVVAAVFQVVAQVGLAGLLDTMEAAGADPISEAQLRITRECFTRQDDESMRACATALSASNLLGSFEDLAALSMPVLVIGRPGDALHPVELAHQYVRYLREVRLVIDDAPDPFLLRPQAYADLLVDFHG